MVVRRANRDDDGDRRLEANVSLLRFKRALERRAEVS